MKNVSYIRRFLKEWRKSMNKHNPMEYGNLIEKILADLFRDKTSLSNILVTTRYLAKQINDKKLYEWTNNEIVGFYEGTVPSYRVVRGQIIATVIIPGNKISNYIFKLRNEDDETRKTLETVWVGSGINSLEKLVNKNVYFPVDSNAIPYLYDDLKKDGMIYSRILNPKISLGPGAIPDLLLSLKTTLLDQLQTLQNDLGISLNIETFKKEKKMNSKVIVKGNKNVVTAGDNNRVEVEYNIINNKTQLKKTLLGNNVTEEDAKELLKIIDFEKPNFDSKEFGSQVKNWFNRWIKKSIDVLGPVAIGTTANLVSNAIWLYYTGQTLIN